MKRKELIIGILLAAGLFFRGFTDTAGEKTAAKVDGIAIPVSEVEKNIQMIRARESQANGLDSSKLDELRKMVLDVLIEKAVFEQEAKKIGLVVSDKILTEKIQELIRINGMKSMAELQAFIKDKEKLSFEEFRKNLRYLILKEMVIDTLLSDFKDSAQFYYINHKDEFKEEKIAARHILISYKGSQSNPSPDRTKTQAKLLADEILKNVRQNPKNFAELAKKHSDCPSAEKGGDLGEFSRGEMVSAFDNAVFALKKGGIAGPVETSFGYHIILAGSNVKSKTYPMSDSLRAYIIGTVYREGMEKTLDALKVKHKIQRIMGEK